MPWWWQQTVKIAKRGVEHSVGVLWPSWLPAVISMVVDVQEAVRQLGSGPSGVNSEMASGQARVGACIATMKWQVMVIYC
jgi:hypothetical protein